MSTVLVVGSSSHAGRSTDPRERRSTRRGRLVTGACPSGRAPDTRPPRRPPWRPSRRRAVAAGRPSRRGRPRRRAATSFASAAVPPVFFVTTVSTRCRVSSATSSSTSNGPRSSTTSASGRTASSGSMARTRNHSPEEPAKGSRLWRPRARKTRSAPRAGERFGGGRERRGVVPAVAHERRPRRAAAAGSRATPVAGRGLGGVERHDGGERMGGVDERVDRLVGQVAGEARRRRRSRPAAPARAASTGLAASRPASELVTSWPVGRRAGRPARWPRSCPRGPAPRATAARVGVPRQGLVPSRLGPAAWYVPPQDTGNTGANPGLSSNCHRGAIPHTTWSRPRRGWKAEGERRSGSQDTCVCEPSRSTLGDVTR